MFSTMYDSVTAADIPRDATIVGGYVDGDSNVRWKPRDWELFPRATLIRIATNANTNDGNELDVEFGAAKPDEAAGWVKLRLAAGLRRVSIYMNRSTWPAVEQAINRAGLAEHVVYRVAEWTGSPHSIPGAWAVQYADQGHGSGGHFDLNRVDDLSWLDGNGTRNMRLTTPHMTGNDVRQLQQALVDHGMALVVDGDFGPLTEGAVRRFQELHGLVVDGIAGPKTAAALTA